MSNKTKGNVLIITTALIGAIIVITVFYNLFFKPKPDYNGYINAVNTYTNQLSGVVDFRSSNNDYTIIYLTLDTNMWDSTSTIDKITFCDNIRKTYTAYAWKYNLLGDNETVYAIFESENGIKLAEPKFGFGDYNILH